MPATSKLIFARTFQRMSKIPLSSSCLLFRLKHRSPQWRPAVPPPSVPPSVPADSPSPRDTKQHLTTHRGRRRDADGGKEDGRGGGQGRRRRRNSKAVPCSPAPSLALPRPPSIHLTSLHSHSVPPSLPRALTAAFLATHARVRRG